jgi:hypothetical protein
MYRKRSSQPADEIVDELSQFTSGKISEGYELTFANLAYGDLPANKKSVSPELDEPAAHKEVCTQQHCKFTAGN